jgi:hypothetical protein
MRIYWPWWLFPVAFAVWFVKAMMRLAAWPFQLAAQRSKPRQSVTIRVRVTEKDDSDGL